MASRVLVVDDDPGILELLRVALAVAALEADFVDDGEKALELLRIRSYAVMLLDLRMPRIDGPTVLSHLQGLSARPIVFVITGHHDAFIERLDGNVASVIVRKPFDVANLSAVVSECVAELDRHMEH